VSDGASADARVGATDGNDATTVAPEPASNSATPPRDVCSGGWKRRRLGRSYHGFGFALDLHGAAHFVDDPDGELTHRTGEPNSPAERVGGSSCVALRIAADDSMYVLATVPETTLRTNRPAPAPDQSWNSSVVTSATASDLALAEPRHLGDPYQAHVVFTDTE